MALWPFRRKSSRRRARTAPIGNSATGIGKRGRQEPAPSRTHTEPASAVKERDERVDTKRTARTYSFSPGRRDSLRVAKTRKESIPPLPSGPIPTAVTNRVSTSQGILPGGDNEIAGRVPTLHHENSRNKRRAQPLPRKKSSKRRKEDHDREAEIKAMSHFMPVRPATDNWTPDAQSKKDGKRFRPGLNRSWNDPSSDVSLPISFHSAMSSDSEPMEWKVSALDALAPRPTLRCATNPVYAVGPVRTHSTKRKISERGAISESTLKAHKRIDDLANELDASDLRELMERDKRRREKKQEKEREKVERRLARRAEKQRAEEAEAVKSGTSPPPNLERGVFGRELTPSPHDSTSAVVTSTRRRPSNDTARRKSDQSGELGRRNSLREDSPKPLDTFHRTDSIPLEHDEPSTAFEPPQPEAGKEVVQSENKRSSSPRLLNFIRSRKSGSKSPKDTDQSLPFQAPAPRPDYADSGARTSDSGSYKPWKSFFKWRRNRRSSGPSSFSNTSRDSMLVNTPPQPANFVLRQPSSSVPRRTMSRFREDLPELPMSPPDSRVASPEAELQQSEALPIITDDVQMRYDTPLSGQQSAEAMRETPTSMNGDDAQPSPAPMSMSLASIDSEASWLSGRISRQRASSGMRNSVSQSLQPPTSPGSENMSEPTDDENIVNDEYLNRFVPPHLQNTISVGEARPSSDEEDDQPKAQWGSVGQTPTLMQRRETMRSREGILQSFQDEKEFGKESGGEDDGLSSAEPSPTEPKRATSVKLKKGHLRNFSAGSAKLFEISPRPSGEQKRGVERGTQ